MALKVVELYPVEISHVDDFCEHEIIGDKVHVIGYAKRREVGSEEVIGVVAVRLAMTPESFFAVCRRGVALEQSGQMPVETAYLSKHHH